MESCRLDWSERDRNQSSLRMHRDLIALRRNDPVISAQHSASSGQLDGAVLDDEAFLLRYFSDEHGDRLLVVNLGIGLKLHPAPEPLLAPPTGMRWSLEWSSESAEYGGYGTPPIDAEGEGFCIPSQCALLLVARPES